MKNERIEEPEITLVTPKVEARSCPPYSGGRPGPGYPDGYCEPNCSPRCNPNCIPACPPSSIPCNPRIPCFPDVDRRSPPSGPGPN